MIFRHPMRKHIFAGFFYVVSSVLFFGRLIFPTLQTYTNPEYGSSDITHFNIPVRMEYSRALQDGQMPLWVQNMGGGFPLYAESQIGAWYLPNLGMYTILPFWEAFAMSYMFAWFIGMFGMYAWLYQRSRHVLASCIGGWVFAFSGYFIGHINHLNMLQSASLIPWILLLHAYAKNTASWAWGLVVILVSQHIIIGHLQTSFILGCVMLMYEGVYAYEEKKSPVYFLKHVIYIILVFVVAGLLSAIQILPSLELHGLSIRSDVFSLKETIHFSLHPKMFTTFFVPFSQGQLADGTFTFLSQLRETGTIFWESWMYMGWISSVLLIGSLVLLRTSVSRRVGALWIILCVMAGLMTARFSPLYFVFSIPPFNYFTTPARWLLPFNITVILLMVEVLRRSPRYVYLICGIALLCDVFFVWYPYGVRVPVKKIESPSQIAQFIAQDTRIPNSEKKVLNIPDGGWHAEFVKNGWKNSSRFTEYFNNINPNMNLIWGINHQHEYVGRIWTQRKYIFDSYFSGLSIPNIQDPRRRVADRLLELASVEYLVSTVAIERDVAYSYSPKGSTSMYSVYDVPSAKPRYWMTDIVQSVESVEDVIDALAEDVYVDGTVFIEDDIFDDTQKSTQLDSTVSITKDTALHTRVKTQSNKDALLVTSDTYYPGWKVTIDGKDVPYFPVNIAQRGVLVPKGKHVVDFQYKPLSYERGRLISGSGYAIVLLVVVLLCWRNRFSSSSK